MAMQSNMSSDDRTASAGTEIADDLYPFLRRYKDGRIERLVTNTFVPASEAPGANGVATRDVVVDPGNGVSARLFLSVEAITSGASRKLPVIVYFHGGGFCTGSAFSKLYHRYAASLSKRAGALVVSVDYRLAPEHPIPAAFDDAWAALRWVTSSVSDPWLACHADLTRVFLAGDSAGANIAHNLVARTGTPEGDDIHIEGMILLQPFFWSPDRLPEEIDDHRRNGGRMLLVPEKLDKLILFLTARKDDPRGDPPAEEVKSLPCRRALVAVASKDLARHRGRRYAAWLRDNGEWGREVTLVESEGEDHVFHLYRPARASAVELMDRVVEFIGGGGGGERAPPVDTDVVVETGGSVLHDPVMNLQGSMDGAKICWPNTSANNRSRDNKIRVTPPRSMALVVGRGRASIPRFGLMMNKGPVQIL